MMLTLNQIRLSWNQSLNLGDHTRLSRADLIPVSPRKLSLSLGLYLSFGHYRIGLLWFFSCLMGLITALMFPGVYVPHRVQHSATALTPGSIVSMTVLGKPGPDPRPLVYDVAYRVQGRGYLTMGYSHRQGPEPALPLGTQLQVRYALDRPQFAVVEGFQDGQKWTALEFEFLLVIWLLLLLPNVFFIMSGLKKLRLVKSGRIVTGEVAKCAVRIRKGNHLVPQVNTYSCSYQVAEQNFLHLVSNDVSGVPAQTGRTVLLAYHPQKPSRAVVIDGLPGEIYFDPISKTIRPPLGALIWRLAFPLLVLSAWIISVLSVWLS